MTTIELSMTARATAVFAAIGRQRGALWIDDATFVEPPFMGCHPVAQLIDLVVGAAKSSTSLSADAVGSARLAQRIAEASTGKRP